MGVGVHAFTPTYGWVIAAVFGFDQATFFHGTNRIAFVAAADAIVIGFAMPDLRRGGSGYQPVVRSGGKAFAQLFGAGLGAFGGSGQSGFGLRNAACSQQVDNNITIRTLREPFDMRAQCVAVVGFAVFPGVAFLLCRPVADTGFAAPVGQLRLENRYAAQFFVNAEQRLKPMAPPTQMMVTTLLHASLRRHNCFNRSLGALVGGANRPSIFALIAAHKSSKKGSCASPFQSIRSRV